jgi:hypothetical protein
MFAASVIARAFKMMQTVSTLAGFHIINLFTASNAERAFAAFFPLRYFVWATVSHHLNLSGSWLIQHEAVFPQFIPFGSRQAGGAVIVGFNQMFWLLCEAATLAGRYVARIPHQ